MATKPVRYIKVIVGRFQPFHYGHHRVLKASLATTDRVVVVIGSADKSGTLKNPWSYRDRQSMIELSLTPKEREKVSFIAQDDVPGDDRAWVTSVKSRVREEAERLFPGCLYHFTLTGCHKGAETYYLKLYRGWTLGLVAQHRGLNATDIRRAYFSGDSEPILQASCPTAVRMFLRMWPYQWDVIERNQFEQIQKELRGEANAR